MKNCWISQLLISGKSISHWNPIVKSECFTHTYTYVRSIWFLLIITDFLIYWISLGFISEAERNARIAIASFEETRRRDVIKILTIARNVPKNRTKLYVNSFNFRLFSCLASSDTKVGVTKQYYALWFCLSSSVYRREYLISPRSLACVFNYRASARHSLIIIIRGGGQTRTRELIAYLRLRFSCQLYRCTNVFVRCIDSNRLSYDISVDRWTREAISLVCVYVPAMFFATLRSIFCVVMLTKEAIRKR